MWKYQEDNTKAIITAKSHIESCHKESNIKLPKTSVLFYMNSGIEYTIANYSVKILTDRFPRFLCLCPIYKFSDYDICFLDGGRGAPQAVDTIETLNAFGVEKIVSIGMFGAFAENIKNGDIIIPNKAFVEEGTSLHYYEAIDYSMPTEELYSKAINYFDEAISLPIVSTDAVYRQTFYKENLWREKDAVGVDMETSALFSVGRYLELNVCSILIASDIHPLTEIDKQWQWNMTKNTRYSFFEKCIDFAKQLNI